MSQLDLLRVTVALLYSLDIAYMLVVSGEQKIAKSFELTEITRQITRACQ